MKKLALLGFMLGLFGVMGAATAADKDDPTGTWKIKAKIGDREIERTLKLENKDGKVTGTTVGGKDKNETKIEDGTFKDGELKFSITREVKDAKITTKYTAKITGDTIKGSLTADFNGKEIKGDFEGKREK